MGEEGKLAGKAKGRGSIYHFCTVEKPVCTARPYGWELSRLFRATQGNPNLFPEKGEAVCVMPALWGESWHLAPATCWHHPTIGLPQKLEGSNSTSLHGETKADSQLPETWVPSSASCNLPRAISCPHNTERRTEAPSSPDWAPGRKGFPGAREQVSITVTLLISVQI